MADEKKAPEDAGEQKKPGLLENKVVVLGAVVALQLVLAVVLTTVVIVPRLGGEPATASAVETPAVEDEPLGQLLSLGEIIVTLQPDQSGSARYLRINVDLELRDAAAVEMATARLPILRDTVIMTLSNRSAADLNRPEGMKGLRDELMRRLDERLPGQILRHLYFSDLVIQ
jgi:flagellar FliL protein